MITTLPECGSSENDALPTSTRSHIRLKRIWLAGTTFTLVAILASGLWLRQMAARQIIVVKLDPKTGLRATFTLSKRWKRQRLDGTLSPHTLDSVTFAPVPPDPIQMWISQHLTHQQFVASDALEDTQFHYETTHSGLDTGSTVLSNGYPDFDAEARRSTPFTKQEFLTVAGQPATYFEVRDPGSLYGFTAGVIVKVRDKPLWYSFGGAGSSANAGLLREEVREVIRSFRIEKATQTGRGAEE